MSYAVIGSVVFVFLFGVHFLAIRPLKTENAELQNQITKMKQEIVNARNLETKTVDDLNQRLTQGEQTLKNEQQKSADLEAKFSNLEKEKQTWADEKKGLEDGKTNLEAENANLKKASDDFKASLDNCQKELEEMKKKVPVEAKPSKRSVTFVDDNGEKQNALPSDPTPGEEEEPTTRPADVNDAELPDVDPSKVKVDVKPMNDGNVTKQQEDAKAAEANDIQDKDKKDNQ